MLPGTEDGLREVKSNLKTAQTFQETLKLYHHPRTVQLFSDGDSSTFCEALWICEDVTNKVKEAVQNVKPSQTPYVPLIELNYFAHERGELSFVLFSRFPLATALRNKEYEILTFNEFMNEAIHLFGPKIRPPYKKGETYIGNPPSQGFLPL